MTINNNLKSNQLIYIDTCSLMNTNSFIKFVESNKDVLQLNEQKIIILGAIHYELNKLLKDEYADHRMFAKKTLDYIYSNKYLFNIYERKEYECFGDYEIQLEMLKNRKSKHQVLITQDHKLARDIYKFNNIESCDGKSINVFSIDDEGHLYFPKYLEQPSTKKAVNNVGVVNDVSKMETSKINVAGVVIVSFIGGVLSSIAAPVMIKKIINVFSK